VLGLLVIGSTSLVVNEFVHFGCLSAAVLHSGCKFLGW
jgi:hypothetical protein